MDPIVKEITVNAPIEKVWEYLTDSKKLERWLMPNNFNGELNKKFNLRCIGHEGPEKIIECELLDIVQYKKLVFSWYSEEIGTKTKVTIYVRKIDNGVLITLTHSGWDKLDANRKHIRDEYKNGWDNFITNNLKSVLIS